MNHELKIELIRQSQQAADPLEFWSYALAAVSAFAQEHIGTENALIMLLAAAADVEGDLSTERAH